MGRSSHSNHPCSYSPIQSSVMDSPHNSVLGGWQSPVLSVHKKAAGCVVRQSLSHFRSCRLRSHARLPSISSISQRRHRSPMSLTPAQASSVPSVLSILKLLMHRHVIFCISFASGASLARCLKYSIIFKLTLSISVKRNYPPAAVTATERLGLSCETLRLTRKYSQYFNRERIANRVPRI